MNLKVFEYERVEFEVKISQKVKQVQKTNYMYLAISKKTGTNHNMYLKNVSNYEIFQERAFFHF